MSELLTADDEWIGGSEAAGILGVSRMTAYRWAKDGMPDGKGARHPLRTRISDTDGQLLFSREDCFICLARKERLKNGTAPITRGDSFEEQDNKLAARSLLAQREFQETERERLRLEAEEKQREHERELAVLEREKLEARLRLELEQERIESRARQAANDQLMTVLLAVAAPIAGLALVDRFGTKPEGDAQPAHERVQDAIREGRTPDDADVSAAFFDSLSKLQKKP